MSTVFGGDVCLLQSPTGWDEKVCLLRCISIAGSRVFGHCMVGAEVQFLFGKQMRDRSLPLSLSLYAIYIWPPLRYFDQLP